MSKIKIDEDLKYMETDREHRKLSQVLDELLTKDNDKKKIRIAKD